MAGSFHQHQPLYSANCYTAEGGGAARVVRDWLSTMDRFLPLQTDTTASRGPQAFLAYDRYHCCARFATNRCIKLLVLVVV
jgi:hypothetical protein